MKDQPAPLETLMPGQLLARGVARHLVSHGFVCVEELVPARGLRVDVMALGPKGEIWVVECKSSRVDFTSDSKWQGYLEWCDRFFWAVDEALGDYRLVAVLRQHDHQIMEVAWSPDGKQLLTTGRDRRAIIWGKK